MNIFSSVRGAILPIVFAIGLTNPAHAVTVTFNGVSDSHCSSFPTNEILKDQTVQWIYGYLAGISLFEDTEYSNNLLNTDIESIKVDIDYFCRQDSTIATHDIAFKVYQRLGGTRFSPKN